MREHPYHFEIKDLIIQLVSALNDCVINRYDEDRSPTQKISVNYVYGPKDGVYFDIIDKQKNVVLPVVSFSLGGVARAENRVRQKQDRVYTRGKGYKIPVPVDITVNMDIWTRYQSDMDQILQNFAVYFDPYIILSWQTPPEVGVSGEEIRSKVRWDGNISINYPKERSSTEIIKYMASTSFVIEGYLFKDVDEVGPPIYKINSKYYPASTNSQLSLLTSLDSFSMTGIPQAKSVIVNSIPWFDDIRVDANANPTLVFTGSFFDRIGSVLLSSDTLTGSVPVSGYALSADYATTSGVPISSYTVVSPGVLSMTLPSLQTGTYDIILSGDGGWTSIDSTFGHKIVIE